MNNQPDGGVSRRNFRAIAGGAAGLAALAGRGLSSLDAECRANIRSIDPDKLELKQTETDILIIGGGMAGLFAAVKGYDAGAKVLLVSKGRLGSSGQTPFAKGIFRYDPAREKLSIDQFVAAVSRSALATNNPVFTRQLAEHALDRVEELRQWGFFDSPLYANAFSKPLTERGVEVRERIMITHLVKEQGRIAGAAGFSFDDGTVHIFHAKSVVLCTGAGGFKPNGFPICDLTHDGTVMAYRIGAKVTGKEWNDGHPGQANNPAACFDGWHGMFERKPGLTGVEIHHDLGVEMNYQAYMAGGPLLGHGPGQFDGKKVSGGPYRPAEFAHPAGGLPGGGEGDRQPRGGGDGGPPGMAGGAQVGGSSAGMSIHKSEGLVPFDETGASNIPGLWAAGDALGSHMAGGIYTQVGSSLAGSAVQGAIAGEAAAAYSHKQPLASLSTQKRKQLEAEILAPLKRDKGYGPAWVTQTLQGIMIPNFVLYIKKEKMLQAALAYIEELRDHHLPLLRAGDLHELRLAHETANMIVNAEMKLRASLYRTESRCSHYRLDYPQLDTKNWNCWVNLYRGNGGEMKLEKPPFGRWPS